MTRDYTVVLDHVLTAQGGVGAIANTSGGTWRNTSSQAEGDTPKLLHLVRSSKGQSSFASSVKGSSGFKFSDTSLAVSWAQNYFKGQVVNCFACGYFNLFTISHSQATDALNNQMFKVYRNRVVFA